MRAREDWSSISKIRDGGKNSIAAAFEPDVLVPAQWFGNVKKELAPEGRLCLAVLDDAVNLIQRGAKNPENVVARYLADEAWDWVESNETSWPFAYLSVCGTVGIDPEYLRRGLYAWDAANAPPRYRKSLHGGKLASVSHRLASVPKGTFPKHHTAHTTAGIHRAKTDPRGSAFGMRNRGGV